MYRLPVLPLDGAVRGAVRASKCEWHMCQLSSRAAPPACASRLPVAHPRLRTPSAQAGLVLCPGNTLPLRLTFRGDRALVQQALDAPAPLTRLLAVVCCQRSYFTPQLMLQR